jgi:hypothetical protein
VLKHKNRHATSATCGALTIPPELMVRTQARRTATEWRDDSEAALEIEARLYRSGFDPIGIKAEVFVQARELFVMFDQLIHSAQSWRIGLLREISIRREFATRVRRVIRAPDIL